MKNVEDTFSHLDFLQNLPDIVQFNGVDVNEPEISADPEIPVGSIQTMDQNTQAPNLPEEISQKQPELLQKIKSRSQFQIYIHDRIAKPLIGPPSPGHTTFTIELKDQTITGFHHLPTDTKSFKELKPMIKGKLKSMVKTLKERNFKEDFKNLKTLPKTLKKQMTKINIDSFKTLPKKIRGLFSSD